MASHKPKMKWWMYDITVYIKFNMIRYKFRSEEIGELTFDQIISIDQSNLIIESGHIKNVYNSIYALSFPSAQEALNFLMKIGIFPPIKFTSLVYEYTYGN